MDRTVCEEKGGTPIAVLGQSSKEPENRQIQQLLNQLDQQCDQQNVPNQQFQNDQERYQQQMPSYQQQYQQQQYQYQQHQQQQQFQDNDIYNDNDMEMEEFQNINFNKTGQQKTLSSNSQKNSIEKVLQIVLLFVAVVSLFQFSQIRIFIMGLLPISALRHEKIIMFLLMTFFFGGSLYILQTKMG